MSIFGGSERFAAEPVRSPGPIYSKPEIRANAGVIMKADYRPVDENRRWGQRESWLGGCLSPEIPVVNKVRSPDAGNYNNNFESVKPRAPEMSFPKSERFLSQKVNMIDSEHQRELFTVESPGPKYNVNNLAANGGKAAPLTYSFAAPSLSKPGARVAADSTRLPDVESPRSDRDSWMYAINRNGLLIMPASPVKPRHVEKVDASEQAFPEENTFSSTKNGGNAFGHEHRFGSRQHPASKPSNPTVKSARVQYMSASHTRENMGAFSPGPIYSPNTPKHSGGRFAPTGKSSRRPPPFGSPAEVKDPNANMSSRASWLAGAVRKSAGQEMVLLKSGDVPPGPGSYSEPPSSFTSFSHNIRARPQAMPRNRSFTMPSPRPTSGYHRDPLPAKDSAVTRPPELTKVDNQL